MVKRSAAADPGARRRATSRLRRSTYWPDPDVDEGVEVFDGAGGVAAGGVAVSGAGAGWAVVGAGASGAGAAAAGGGELVVALGAGGA
jgi:hypothetical protein